MVYKLSKMSDNAASDDNNVLIYVDKNLWSKIGLIADASTLLSLRLVCKTIKSGIDYKFTLQHIKDLVAVQRNGLALKYVEDQTPEICLAAVQENGHALKYVKVQTPEICMAAVQQNGNMEDYVDDEI